MRTTGGRPASFETSSSTATTTSLSSLDPYDRRGEREQKKTAKSNVVCTSVEEMAQSLQFTSHGVPVSPSK